MYFIFFTLERTNFCYIKQKTTNLKELKITLLEMTCKSTKVKVQEKSTDVIT